MIVYYSNTSSLDALSAFPFVCDRDMLGHPRLRKSIRESADTSSSNLTYRQSVD